MQRLPQSSELPVVQQRIIITIRNVSAITTVLHKLEDHNSHTHIKLVDSIANFVNCISKRFLLYKSPKLLIIETKNKNLD